MAYRLAAAEQLLTQDWLPRCSRPRNGHEAQRPPRRWRRWRRVARRAIPTLAAIVRERQDLVAEWQKRDAARSAAVSQPPDKRDKQAEAANVARLAEIDTRIAEIDKQLAKDFPDYAALASPKPLSIADVQSQLRDSEALVLFLDTPEWKPTPEETFIWVVTKTDSRWVKSDIGTKALGERVAALRCGLDSSNWTDASDVV